MMNTNNFVNGSSKALPSQQTSSMENNVSLPLPITNNPLLRPVELSRKEIYQKIDDVLCKIQTSKGIATGFCIGENLIVVPFHVLGHTHSTSETDSDLEEITVETPITCIYQGILYKADYQTINTEAAMDYDFAIFKIEDPDFFPRENLSIFEGTIEPGEEVYFGGFPLTQNTPTFHGGFVSSAFEQEKTSFFTIDGTIVSGNSGGPVFICHENELKLIGAISQQVADFNSESKRLIKILEQLKKQNDENHSSKDYIAILEYHKNCSQFKNPPEEIHFNEVDAICMALDLIKRNLSTGIGTVLHVKHLMDVIKGQEVPQPIPFMTGQPVMKGEKLPGMLARDPVYKDWYHRHVKGKNLCPQILGRQIAPAELINAEEEKVLWQHYQDQPQYNGFEKLTPEGEFNKLKDRILSAKPKALKSHKAAWKKSLEDFKQNMPAQESEIDKLLEQLR